MESKFNNLEIQNKLLEMDNSRQRQISRSLSITAKIASYVVLIFWTIISFYPFIWSVFVSFKSPYLLPVTGLNPFPAADGWTTENYTSIFSETGFSDFAVAWISNSIVYSVSASLLNATLNLLGGYALARIAMKGKNIVVMYFLVSILVPAQATFIPTYYIFVEVGIISITTPASLFLLGVIFSGMANIVMTFMARQFFLTQSAESEEAGKTDGYSALGIFFFVTLRKMLPLFATQFVMVFMGSWNNFLVFQLYSVGDPNKMTINSGIFTIAKAATDKNVGSGQALAMSNISFIPMIILYGFSLKIQLRGIQGGNK